jgi:hypothetical protein
MSRDRLHMLNQRLAAARSVSADLHKFEAALDEAIALGAQLSARMVTARMEAKLSAVLGQEALDGVVRSVSTMVNARRELVEAHNHLANVKDEIGLRTVAMGDLMKPPSAQTTSSPQLHAVG